MGEFRITIENPNRAAGAGNGRGFGRIYNDTFRRLAGLLISCDGLERWGVYLIAYGVGAAIMGES